MPEIEPTTSDTCRPVEVDGETVLIRGSGDFTEQERGFAAEIVRAAKRKYAAEHPDTEVVLTAPRRPLVDDAEQLVAEARAAIARARALADRWDNALAPDKPYARDLRDALGTTEPPLSPYYSHEVCGFHWHGRDGLDIPVRDGQPICPRCELEEAERRTSCFLRDLKRAWGERDRASAAIERVRAVLDDPACPDWRQHIGAALGGLACGAGSTSPNAIGNERCALLAGHQGRHADGTLTWPVDAPAGRH